MTKRKGGRRDVRRCDAKQVAEGWARGALDRAPRPTVDSPARVADQRVERPGRGQHLLHADAHRDVVADVPRPIRSLRPPDCGRRGSEDTSSRGLRGAFTGRAEPGRGAGDQDRSGFGSAHPRHRRESRAPYPSAPSRASEASVGEPWTADHARFVGDHVSGRHARAGQDGDHAVGVG